MQRARSVINFVSVISKFIVAAMPSALLAYVLMSPAVATGFFDRCVFLPSRADHPAYRLTEIAGVPRQEVSIMTTSRHSLNAWFFRPPSANKIVIISHGNNGNITRLVEMIRAFINSNTAVLAYDYQGYGKSDGSPSLQNIIADGNAAYDYTVKVLKFQSKNIILVGESLGCAVTTEVARAHPCAGMILQCSFTSLPNIARDTCGLLKFYPDCLIANALNNTSNLSDIDVPVLFIHGKDDSIIPYQHSIANYNAARGPKSLYLIEGAQHGNYIDVAGPQYDAVISRFIVTLGNQGLTLN